jgi:hypothetical protein
MPYYPPLHLTRRFCHRRQQIERAGLLGLAAEIFADLAPHIGLADGGSLPIIDRLASCRLSEASSTTSHVVRSWRQVAGVERYLQGIDAARGQLQRVLDRLSEQRAHGNGTGFANPLDAQLQSIAGVTLLHATLVIFQNPALSVKNV